MNRNRDDRSELDKEGQHGGGAQTFHLGRDMSQCNVILCFPVVMEDLVPDANKEEDGCMDMQVVLQNPNFQVSNFVIPLGKIPLSQMV